MAGFATRNRFPSHPYRSTRTPHALRLEMDHLIGAGHDALDFLGFDKDGKQMLFGKGLKVVSALAGCIDRMQQIVSRQECAGPWLIFPA